VQCNLCFLIGYGRLHSGRYISSSDGLKVMEGSRDITDLKKYYLTV
jgi:hypothetical protein